MHSLPYVPSGVAKMITGSNLRPSVMALACAAVAAFGFTAETLKAEEVSNQPGLRDILADLAAGRNVSARVSLPLTIGFFNGQTSLYITPEVGVDPSAGQAPSPLPNKSRWDSTLISFLRTSRPSPALARSMTSLSLPTSTRAMCWHLPRIQLVRATPIPTTRHCGR